MGESTRKGLLVEQVVAKLHVTPGVTIQTRARLPSISGMGGKREIDVLLTSLVAGYSIKIATECKNEDKSIQAPVRSWRRRRLLGPRVSCVRLGGIDPSAQVVAVVGSWLSYVPCRIIGHYFDLLRKLVLRTGRKDGLATPGSVQHCGPRGTPVV